MKRILVASAFAVLALSGCTIGTDATGDASAADASAAGSSSTVTPPPIAATPTPAGVDATSAATGPVETAPEVDPASPSLLPDALPLPASDAPMPSGQALYDEICQRFIVAIDALEASGASDRQRSVDGISSEMQASDEWKTVPDADKQEILRGLAAAGAGRC